MSNVGAQSSIEGEKAFWDARWQADHVLRPDEKEKLATILEMMPEKVEKLLDVGCGTGWMLESLKPRRVWAVGLDFSVQGLKRVKITNGPVAGSGTDLPFQDHSFDLVLCAEVLEHYPNGALEMAVAELSRVSRHYVLVTVPFEEKRLLNMVQCSHCMTEFHSSLHMRSFGEMDLISLFQPHGFAVAKIRRAGYEPYRSIWLSRLNASVTGYHSFWRPELRCPVCGSSEVRRRRARENPISLILESVNWILGRFLPAKPHNLCILFEKGCRS
jgi:2-polyprenyl-3-methyl-5-hydroxy-6-metoxy-1,4-benzoquinol methylase